MEFIRLFDRLFDVLNSRNPCAKVFKSALRIGNKESWSPFLTSAFNYIINLKDSQGKSMHTTRRKTGFVGFLVAITSVKGIFNELVQSPQAPLKSLLTYKLSQDQLELFFGTVRSAGGFNNNPTVQQFTSAYKRLLVRSCCPNSTNGNCSKQNKTEILRLFDDTYHAIETTVTMTTAALIRKYDMAERTPLQDDHDYHDAPNFLTSSLSEFKKAAISYIAGYAVKMTKKTILCDECCDALGSATS